MTTGWPERHRPGGAEDPLGCGRAPRPRRRRVAPPGPPGPPFGGQGGPGPGSIPGGGGAGLTRPSSMQTKLGGGEVLVGFSQQLRIRISQSVPFRGGRSVRRVPTGARPPAPRAVAGGPSAGARPAPRIAPGGLRRIPPPAVVRRAPPTSRVGMGRVWALMFHIVRPSDSWRVGYAKEGARQTLPSRERSRSLAPPPTPALVGACPSGYSLAPAASPSQDHPATRIPSLPT